MGRHLEWNGTPTVLPCFTHFQKRITVVEANQIMPQHIMFHLPLSEQFYLALQTAVTKLQLIDDNDI